MDGRSSYITYLMKKFCPVSIRENPELRPPPVVVFISTPAVMYIMAFLLLLLSSYGATGAVRVPFRCGKDA